MDTPMALPLLRWKLHFHIQVVCKTESFFFTYLNNNPHPVTNSSHVSKSPY
jgi:hypothetical protein